MKCVICKTGESSEAKTTLTFEKNSSVIIFKDVPCMKCEQCGEVYISEEVSGQLFKTLNEVSRYAGEVSIQRFQAA